MFCQKCGAQFDDNAAFCSSCGAPVQPVDAQPVAEQPAVEQPVVEQPVVQQPAMAQPVASATFNSNAIVDKIKNGGWVNLALAFAFVMQFILYFCELIKVTISLWGFKESETGTIADVMDSSALTVFGILFILLALAGIAYLVVKDFIGFSIPVIDPYKKYLLAPAAVSTIFNFIAIFVALGHTKSELGELSDYGGSVKSGLSFGGVLFLLFCIVALGLIGYKAYLIFVKHQED